MDDKENSDGDSHSKIDEESENEEFNKAMQVAPPKVIQKSRKGKSTCDMS